MLLSVAMTPTFPEASVHNLIGDWWEPAPDAQVTRGRLLRALVPYPDMKPYRLVPEGRGDEARQHQRANYRMEEFRIGDPPRSVSTLPVAGLPLRDGETYLVRRGKIRPVVVVALPGGSSRGAVHEALGKLAAPASPACGSVLRRSGRRDTSGLESAVRFADPACGILAVRVGPSAGGRPSGRVHPATRSSAGSSPFF